MPKIVSPFIIISLSLIILFISACTDTVGTFVKETTHIPRGFQAITGHDSGEVILTWNHVEGIGDYILLRSDEMDGEYETIADVHLETVFVDIVIADGKRYYYKVMSANSDGTTSLPTNAVSAVGYYLSFHIDTLHLIRVDSVDLADTVVNNNTIVTTRFYEITIDTTVVQTDTMAGNTQIGLSFFDTLSIATDTMEYRIAYVDTLGITPDTTTAHNTTHAIGYDTVQTVTTDAVITTTMRYEVTIDSTLITSVWYNKGSPFDTTLTIDAITKDTASTPFLTFYDTLGVTSDTTVLIDIATFLSKDTLTSRDSVVQDNRDTVVTTIRHEVTETKTIITTDSLLNLVSFKKVVDTTIVFDTVAIDTTKATLIASGRVGWPSIVILTADQGAVDNGISLSWLNFGEGFKYDLYVARPDRHYNLDTFVALAKDLTTNSYFDSQALPSYQEYILVLRHPELTGEKADTTKGYRQISDREFFIEYNNTIQKSQSKLTLMHKGGTDPIGDETKLGDSSGYVVYHSSTTGFLGLGGAIANLDYTNYRDFHLLVEGSQDTEITNVFTRVGTLTGSTIVMGLYEGKVEAVLGITSGAPSGGYYRITQKDTPPSNVQFTDVRSEVLNNPYRL